MARVYDNWDRLVGATLRREELRLIAERTPSDISSSASSPSSSSDVIAAIERISARLSLAGEDCSSGSDLTKSGRSGDLHHQNIKLGKGLQREVQLIRDELGYMRAFLRVAEAENYDTTEVQEWIRKVREVVCDTDRLLDEFIGFARHHPNRFYGLVQKIFRPCS